MMGSHATTVTGKCPRQHEGRARPARSQRPRIRQMRNSSRMAAALRIATIRSSGGALARPDRHDRRVARGCRTIPNGCTKVTTAFWGDLTGARQAAETELPKPK
jgi:hypothetical protein